MTDQVRDNATEHRFELDIDGHIAAAYYRRDGNGHLVLTHTEVPSEYGGQGLGSTLARGVFDMARERGDKLVLNTKYLYPADFTRWSPMTSNQFETVEIWQLKKYDGGIERLEVQATFYDKYAFVKPVSAVYAFRHATDLEKADYRVNHWECEQTTNAYYDKEKGVTNFHLPGEEGFNDGRGSTLFPELPGQTRDPIYNTTLGN